MSDLLKRVDARTCLAGTNNLEILLFTLASAGESQRTEMFGINVFKVREVMRAPPITPAPRMAAAVVGMVSMRGALIPVIDLARYVGLRTQAEGTVLIVTEYSGHTQGFLVEAVDTILRLDWSVMKAPPAMLSSRAGGLVTAVTELPDGRLVMMMDVERVLADTADATGTDLEHRSIRRLGVPGRTVLFADDSAIARRQIAATLNAMDVDHIGTRNGGEAWSALEQLANRAGHEGRPLSDYVQAVLTDVEMPEMDGYMLTRKIKSDRRFAGLPVIMHSSLTGASNRHLGESVGVDEYVFKFEPQRLADVLGGLLA